MKTLKFVLKIICLAALVLILFRPALAKSPDELQKEIENYQSQLDRLALETKTLQNQIAQFDTQIKLAELKIAQTEEKISLLGSRIDQLEVSLTSLSKSFNSRVVETYKMRRLADPLLLVLTADNLSQAASRFQYLKKIQAADRDLMQKLQSAQTTYKTQKDQEEILSAELSKQRDNLNNQKKAKANLLIVTRNDEKRYQQLLAQAKAEYEAIQAIIAGKGQEEEVGDVSDGQRIANAIQGESCNSTGTHIHFMVSTNGNTQNPFNYLKPVDYENCSGPGLCSSADPFTPSGTWNWPLSPKITFKQGYGVTWAVLNDPIIRSYYNFHNGIDISGTSLEVRAVKAGKLYRGSYDTGRGCRLRYVRVRHNDGSLDTYYLHVNY